MSREPIYFAIKSKFEKKKKQKRKCRQNSTATADAKWEISLNTCADSECPPHWQRLRNNRFFFSSFLLLLLLTLFYFFFAWERRKKKHFRLVFRRLVNCIFYSSPFESKTAPKVKNKSVTVLRVLLLRLLKR